MTKKDKAVSRWEMRVKQDELILKDASRQTSDTPAETRDPNTYTAPGAGEKWRPGQEDGCGAAQLV